MKKSVLFLLLCLNLNAFAENVTCVLASGQEKSVAVAEFSEMEDDYIFVESSDANFDLSFTLEGECYDDKCEIYSTFDSQILEDEAGQIGFELDLVQDKYGRVFGEEVTNAPDGRDYGFYCYYNK
jgi:hypothetical protein